MSQKPRRELRSDASLTPDRILAALEYAAKIPADEETLSSAAKFEAARQRLLQFLRSGHPAWRIDP